MGLAEPKLSGKKVAQSWQAQRHREKMLNTSITSAPTLAIGLKLMEKMGWKDGQGLGASEQGIVEPIRLKQTINNKGLGYSNVTGLEQMHYSAHFERFESVLASLGGKEETPIEPSKDKMKTKKPKKAKQLDSSSSKSVSSESNDTNSCSSDEESSSDKETAPLKKNIKKSLESLSRNVRGRVHYQKFTRGKDVSRYSENDLACILGAKAHALYTANVKGKEEESGKFVFGSLDSQAYFAQQNSASCTPSESRSQSDTDEPKTFTPSYPLNAVSDDEEELSRPCFGGLGFGAAEKSNDDDVDTERPSFGGVGGDDAVQKCFQNRFAAKYMSAFVKADDELTGTLTTEVEEKADNSEQSCTNGGNVGSESADTDVKETETEGKKKRKKNKVQLDDNHESELVEDPLPKKKKKKSKKERDVTEECSPKSFEDECCDAEREDASVKEKRKKKSKVEEDGTECFANTEIKSKTEKKKKKKRKREDACEVANDTTEQETAPSDDDLPAPKKKKSKRKNKSNIDEIVENMPNSVTESPDSEVDRMDDTSCEKPKKKKKKSSS